MVHEAHIEVQCYWNLRSFCTNFLEHPPILPEFQLLVTLLLDGFHPLVHGSTRIRMVSQLLTL